MSWSSSSSVYRSTSEAHLPGRIVLGNQTLSQGSAQSGVYKTQTHSKAVIGSIINQVTSDKDVGTGAAFTGTPERKKSPPSLMWVNSNQAITCLLTGTLRRCLSKSWTIFIKRRTQCKIFDALRLTHCHWANLRLINHRKERAPWPLKLVVTSCEWGGGVSHKWNSSGLIMQ